ncbi:hypothetical protein BMF94_0752 [Rhodotorula taiwanensis]|uniref:Uncharacterized protein n=1 Tax=Rhodotorula taiwanensis TaxID=741276 RepID=A0A2S5BGX6_9BASI|nr:hypothetical protein BMF94_0752 [Rhodotorula taiwanensis]
MSTGWHASRTPNPYPQTDGPCAPYTSPYPSYDTQGQLHNCYQLAGPSSPRQDRPAHPDLYAAAAGPSSDYTNSLVPLDQVVRVNRERTNRAASTTSLPTWSDEPPSSNGSLSVSTARGPPANDPASPQQRITRKLTKHRRSSSSLGAAASYQPHTAPYHDYLARPPPLSPSSSYAAAPPRPPLPPTPPSHTSYSSSRLSSPGLSPHGTFPGNFTSSPSPSLSSDPRRHSYSHGYQTYPHSGPLPPPPPPPPPRPRRTESEEEQVERARRESLAAEQARLASLAAADELLLHLTLAESTSSAAADRSRAEAAELRAIEDVIRQSRAEEERRMLEERRRSEAEEEAVRRAIEASHVEEVRAAGKGKGRQETPQDDAEVEQAIRLSMEEDERRSASWQSLASSPYRDFGATETSAQAFARYSQPGLYKRPPTAESASVGASSSSPQAPLPRRGASLLLDPDPALEFSLDPDGGAPDFVPPPAYELPAHAPELDRPEDVIFGPGRPLPAPVAPTSTRRRPLPIPPLSQPQLSPRSHVASTASQQGFPPLSTLPMDLLSDSAETDSHELEMAAYPPLLHAGANPFDDRFEDKEYEWSSDSSRSATPVSFFDGAKSLYDDVLARRATRAGEGASFVDLTGPNSQDMALRPESFSPTRPAGSVVGPALEPSDVPPASVAPPPAPTESMAPAPRSPIPGIPHSIPSFGGYVEEGTSVLASERILREVKWGFADADLSKSGRRPPLEYEGDFPRGAQLSLLADADGRQPYSSFAVEARTWQGLLIYLMWHGDSRFEAAPSDLERDKAGRGYQVAVSLDFYRSPSSSGAAVSIRPPRVRARLTLLPLSSAPAPPAQPDSPASSVAISIVSTPSFDAVNPNIRLELALPPTLPIALSALAGNLADAASLARRTVEAQHSRHGKAPAVVGPSPGQQALVNAIALFRRLGGEEPADRPDARAHEEEASLLHRMKARLKRRKVIQRLPTDPNSDPRALMITPFPLDRYIDDPEAA